MFLVDRLVWTSVNFRNYLLSALEPEDMAVLGPFLTETVVAPAFSDTNFLLQPGVHLHWALPTALTRAVHPLDPQTGQPDRQRKELPSGKDR